MKNAIARRIRHLIAVLAHYSGADALYRRATGSGLVVLMLHRIRDDHDPYPLSISLASLARLVAWLRQADLLTDLDQGLAALSAAGTPKTRYALTLDDGYRDNLNLLDPALGKVPAVLYLATDHIGGEPIWIYRLLRALEERSNDRIDLRAIGLGDYDLGRETERARLLSEVPVHLKRLPHEEFCPQLEKIMDALAPVADGRRERDMLDWDEVRRLHANGIDIGAHTRRHVLLSRAGDELAREEIVGSRDRIADELGVPPRHFAYPNGSPEDFGERDVRTVGTSGFATSVTTVEGVNRAGTPHHLLLRYNVHESRYRSPSGRLSRALFFSETSGLLGWMRNLRNRSA